MAVLVAKGARHKGESDETALVRIMMVMSVWMWFCRESGRTGRGG